MRAHSFEWRSPDPLTQEQKDRMHPMQIEMLEQEPHFGRFGTLHGDAPNWELEQDDRDTCSYCGSLSIDGVIEALQTKGTEYSGSDWKYGWPHKFYLEIPCEPYERIVGSRYEGDSKVDERATVNQRHYRFYSRHLLDATPQQMEAWNQVAKPLLGVGFELDEEGLRWTAPESKSHYGYQAHGVVE